ncbi:hypothetical protein K505DRAFT_293195 [Melanomma pulvis-pyrius CBS 109.77]|uniref:Uncharacterized protein n=1 Tax=Melanomma pulvis-pyrius CBS 109.77 TaxID=1314802 RepID=A0A6A6XUK0_9PLEO|nr:hypothetical protein K505DRAFT_293195 [Melanomma pulvis-pyrius CBS 109.77]
MASATGQVVAALNMKTFRSFDNLQQTSSVRFDASIPSQAWYQFSKSFGNNNDSRIAMVNVNIYGYQFDADEVATKLSMASFFLQDPHWIHDTIPYHNPQYFDLPDVFYAEIPCVESPITPGTQKQPKSKDNIDIGDDGYFLDFDQILYTLACHDGLVQVSAVPQISTNLLSHQKEGLDFILQKETNSPNVSPQSRSLWELQETENGSSIYQHTITGSKSPVANDCLGGIVADEMGLGKSLTMLSAIAGSIEKAFAYACAMTNIGSTGKDVIAAKSTLVIVPSALLMDSWIDEINKHIEPGTLSYYKFHGQGRKIFYPHLLQHDVILTTYGTVAADFTRDRSLLHFIHWYRIVLDEAHVIRNCSTKQFRAVTSLHSLFRWCLTGTPIQNSLEDLGSLVRFLKLPILEESAQFKRHIASKVQRTKWGPHCDFDNLRALLRSVCLRRTKAVLPMSKSTTYTHWLDFTPEEIKGYTKVERICKEALDLAISGHNVKEAHQTVLEILLRLRLFCNNGTVYDKLDLVESRLYMDPEEALSLLQHDGEAICYYCSCDIQSLTGLEHSDSACLTTCQRAICGECVPIWRSGLERSSKCPICHSHHGFESAVSIGGEQVIGRINYPSKMLALCDDIEKFKEECKSVVFSFWKKSLDIAGSLFNSRGIPFLRVDGSLILNERKKVLNDFRDKDNVRVILMTLGTGAVGLNNLSVANRIHILEPQWNPSVESQAIGRVLRLGQQNPVTVVRYITKRTVEKVRRMCCFVLFYTKSCVERPNTPISQTATRKPRLHWFKSRT